MAIGHVDGRRLRAERTRAAIARALVALANEGQPSPSKEQIAERAGVSARAVFIHFPNVLDLVRAELEGMLQAIAQPYRYEPGDPFGRRLGIFVERARETAERIAPVRAMATTLASLHEPLRVAGDKIAGQLRVEIDAAFAAELADLTPIDRLDCTIAIAALMSSAIADDVRRLCGDAHRDVATFRANAVRRLLGQPPG